NAAASIGRCLESLKRLNYPDYEVIVVDDGSTDSTAAIAEAADVRTLKLAHRGLGAARNAGLEAAAGRIVAFIDADAEADRDWLYHLGEAITRREAAAVGGQNFSPVRTSAMARAIAAAPGQPREVRAGDQDLAQLCGCSMALDKNRLEPDEAFDPAFASAGDDVDLSWRLRDAGLTLAYAPGAVVIHERRATLRAYLKQQRGYGHAEGLLYRKYPRRGASGEGIYAGSGWLAQWFGAGQRIYYGAFGRGLFQTVYPGAPLPMAAQLPLTIEWVAIAAVLALAGVFDPAFGALGIAGLVITVLCACAGAALTPRRELAGVSSRVMLALLWLLGPLVRSWERQRVKWSFKPEADGGAAASTALHGTLAVPGLVPTPREAATRGSADLPDIDAMTSVMHLTLVRRGLAVVKGTTYDPFDLQIETVPLIHVPMVFLSNGGSVSLGWRTGIAQWRAAAIAAALFILLMIGGIPVIGAIMIVVLTAIVGAGVAWSRARRIPAVISAALTEVAPKLATLDPRAVSSTTEAAD
ncbi:MAG TPA: glycosyltransferase, partial [Candidatus Binataceae bacterium]|nr:glycosyltransferase [Candidatus Binataceae bacterium]